jgi:hypothetical protein
MNNEENNLESKEKAIEEFSLDADRFKNLLKRLEEAKQSRQASIDKLNY